MYHASALVSSIVGLVLLGLFVVFLGQQPPVSQATVVTPPTPPTAKISWDQGRVEEAANRARSIAKFLGDVKLVLFDPSDPGEKLVVDGTGTIIGKLTGPLPTKKAVYGELLLADCVRRTLRILSFDQVFFVFNVNNSTVKEALKNLYWLRLEDLTLIKTSCQ